MSRAETDLAGGHGAESPAGHGHGDHDGHGHGSHGHGDHHDDPPEREAPQGQSPGHSHGHGHGVHGSSRALRWALGLTASFMVVEAAAGIWTGGLALLADAAHMLADAGSLGLALFANEWAKRPRTAKSTFGHRRAEVLAAFVNGIALAVTALGIVIEAVERWNAPHDVRAVPMLITAGTGLGVNLLVGAILAGSSKDSMNVRAAMAHVALDAVGSIGAMVAATLILFFGLSRADSVVSMGIAVLVAYGGWHVLREATSILLEAAPGHIDVEAVERSILECTGVSAVHDLHVWRISDWFDALTVHVTLAKGAHGVDVCRGVARRLKDAFGLEHVTVQPEAPPPEEIVRLRSSKDGPNLRLP